MAIFFDPRFWLAIVLWTAGVAFVAHYRGANVERLEMIAEQAKVAAQARETEQDLQRLNNRDTAAYITRILKQQEKSRALPKITLVTDCAVPADVGRVLNDAQRLPSDAGTGSGSGTASPAADSTCAAELDIAKRNYADVCIPNAEQLTALQKRWNETRARINRN